LYVWWFINPLNTGLHQAFSQSPKRGRPILVQRYIYSKVGGSRKRSSICSKLGRNFSNTLGFVSTEFVRYCAAMLLYLTTTFSFSQVNHQIDQNVKCIIIMRIEAISFQIY
jgi:hypothetical protein